MEIPVCWGSFIEGSLKVLLMAPVEVGSLSHDLQGFKYIPRWFAGFVPSTAELVYIPNHLTTEKSHKIILIFPKRFFSHGGCQGTFITRQCETHRNKPEITQTEAFPPTNPPRPHSPKNKRHVDLTWELQNIPSSRPKYVSKF